MISFDRCRAVLNELGPIFQHSFGLNKLLKKEVSRDSENMNFCLVLRSSSITLKSFRPSLISSSSYSTPNARVTSATENSRRDSTRTSGMVYLRYIPTSWFSIVNITEYAYVVKLIIMILSACTSRLTLCSLIPPAPSSRPSSGQRQTQQQRRIRSRLGSSQPS